MQPSKDARLALVPLSHPSVSARWLSIGQPGLDKALGGGFPTKTLTEVFGKSSSGKTQLAMQLCLTVQLSEVHGGFGQEAVYISTEKEFPVERFSQIASSYIEKHSIDNLDVDMLTKRVHVNTVSSARMFKEVLVRHLPPLLSRQDVGLVIIDSIGALFRGYMENDQNELLAEIADLLTKLSNEYDLVTICTNQVSQIIRSHKGIPEPNNKDTNTIRNGFTLLPEIELNLHRQVYSISKLSYRPALGLAWSNLINARFLIARCASGQESDFDILDSNGDIPAHYKQNTRKLVSFTCPWSPPCSSLFVIEKEGLVDV